MVDPSLPLLLILPLMVTVFPEMNTIPPPSVPAFASHVFPPLLSQDEGLKD